jgi:hypothetical protein
VSKVTIEPNLYESAKKAAEVAGYSSVDEFVVHCLESEIRRLKVEAAESQVADQLRGLGYLN